MSRQDEKKLARVGGMCLIKDLSVHSDNEGILKNVCEMILSVNKGIRSFKKIQNDDGSATLHFFWGNAKDIRSGAENLPCRITDSDTLFTLVKAWFSSEETTFPSRLPNTDGSYAHSFVARSQNWQSRNDYDPADMSYQVISFTTSYMIYGK